MPRYFGECKQALLAKRLPPHELTSKTVADQKDVTFATIYIGTHRTSLWRTLQRSDSTLEPGRRGIAQL